MKNIYHRDIVDFLLAAGSEGMKLCNIARKVYNRHADLFVHDVDYDNIHASIGLYLWRESHRRASLFMRCAYGVYAIKPAIAVQLDLFVDMPNGDRENEPAEVPSARGAVQLEFRF